MRTFNKKELNDNRRELRNNSTHAEIILWKYLQKGQLEGRRFRRQFSIGYYIADFYCPSEKLVVELDGEGHFTPEGLDYDKVRKQYFESLGIREIRFENKEVLYNIDVVLNKIKEKFIIK